MDIHVVDGVPIWKWIWDEHTVLTLSNPSRNQRLKTQHQHPEKNIAHKYIVRLKSCVLVSAAIRQTRVVETV